VVVLLLCFLTENTQKRGDEESGGGAIGRQRRTLGFLIEGCLGGD
jgi:hypothetical protein